MDLQKNYLQCPKAQAAILLLLGSGGNNALTKSVARWFVRQGVSALCLGPEDDHSFPLENLEAAS